MILKTFQAQSLYDAICAINNLGGSLTARFDGVKVEANDHVLIEGPDSGIDGGHTVEHFPSQDAFALAYRLA